jgi:predicted metal-dependent peptidase
MTQVPHEVALSKAKIALMSRNDSAFFTHLAFSLLHEFDDSIRTACTNGTRIKYSPAFFMSLDHEERLFLILHEAMHCALLHMERLGSYNPRKWNVAADHCINLMLIERGFKMPKVGLADPQYKDMSTEQIYHLLPEEPDQGEGGGIGQDLQEPAGPLEELANEIQDILVRASIASKLAEDKPGTIPGEIEIFLNKLLKPKLPWNKILIKYLHSYSKNDYTFKKPNRRFFPQHHLPSLYSKTLIDLAVAVDTSGSVSDEEFNQTVSETHSMLRMMNPNKITFIQFDTEIKSVEEVKSIRDLMGLKFTGRGGTRIEPVLQWANANKPQLLLIFTDGGFHFHQPDCKVDTLWLIYNNPQFQAPFGKVIHYEV